METQASKRDSLRLERPVSVVIHKPVEAIEKRLSLTALEIKQDLKHDMAQVAEAPRGFLYCLAGGDNSYRAKLVRCDREYYGEEDWTVEDKKYLGAASVFIFFWLCANVYFDKNSFLYNSSVNYVFWAKLVYTVFFNILLSWLVGYFVVRNNINIGYGRKLLHFSLFCTPVIINAMLGPLETKAVDLSWLSLMTTGYFICVLKPVRRRLPVPFMLIFRAIDRPKDRPYTIPWLWVQAILGFMALIMMQLYMSYANLSQAFFIIPLFVNGVGDGLAEPVGIRFGKHKYITRALWHNGRMCYGQFTRSWEGSACVFVSAILAVLAVYSEWKNTTRFVIALVFIPIGMTAAEAFSPHTCDTPFIFLVATALLIFMFEGISDDFDPFSPSYDSG